MAKVATPGENSNLTFSQKIDGRSKSIIGKAPHGGAADISLPLGTGKRSPYVTPLVAEPRTTAAGGKRPKYSFESQLTFSPRLNENSLRIAAGGGRVAHLIRHPQLLKRPDDELEPAKFTFSPRVSERSLRIVEGMNSTFASRQQAAVERRRMLEEMGNTMSCGISSCTSGSCSVGQSNSRHQRASTLPPSRSMLSTRLLKCASTPNLLPNTKARPSPEKSQHSLSNHANLTPLKTKDCGDTFPEGKAVVCRKLLFSRHSTDRERGEALQACRRPKTSLSRVIEEAFSSSVKQHLNQENQKKSSQKKLDDSEKKSPKEQRQQDEFKSHQLGNVTNQTSTSSVEAHPDANVSSSLETAMAPVKKPAFPLKRSSPAKPTSPGKTRGTTMRKPESSIPVDLERVRRVKKIAEQAIKEKHVFSIYGPYPVLRQALRQRGWLEKEYKCHHSQVKSLKEQKEVKESKQAGDSCDDGDDDDDGVDEPLCHEGYEKMTKGEEEEWSMLSRSVRNSERYFIFAAKKDAIDFKYLQRDQTVNHFLENHAFTTKVGLCKTLRQLTCFRDTDVNTFFPRCYLLSCEEEKDEFIDDYHLTAAVSILKSFVSGKNDPLPVTRTLMESSSSSTSLESACNLTSLSADKMAAAKKAHVECSDAMQGATRSGETPKISSTPRSADPGKQAKRRTRVSADAVRLCLRACENHLIRHHHEDIDEEECKLPRLTDVEWQRIVQYLFDLTHHHAVVVGAERLKAEAADVLFQMEEVLPQFKMDGIRNVWILKPGAKSRGRGISCLDQLDDILQVVRTPFMKESKWIIQKYIERPLLVYQTKFDIRQWFLVTDWNPLTMWFYTECYVRFCTQPYTLDDLDSSVHLCNVSVQKNFERSEQRSAKLPDDNIWSSEEFVEYLISQGHEDPWPKIYEGMKEAVISALLCSQDVIETRKNSFELFGADFMLTEDLHPWLIEVNCSPSMSPSSRVTARLCAAVLEDMVKVVIDRRSDKNSDVGAFELAFKQAAVEVPQYIGAQLELCGEQLFPQRRKQN